MRSSVGSTILFLRIILVVFLIIILIRIGIQLQQVTSSYVFTQDKIIDDHLHGPPLLERNGKEYQRLPHHGRIQHHANEVKNGSIDSSKIHFENKTRPTSTTWTARSHDTFLTTPMDETSEDQMPLNTDTISDQDNESNYNISSIECRLKLQEQMRPFIRTWLKQQQPILMKIFQIDDNDISNDQDSDLHYSIEDVDSSVDSSLSRQKNTKTTTRQRNARTYVMLFATNHLPTDLMTEWHTTQWYCITSATSSSRHEYESRKGKEKHNSHDVFTNITEDVGSDMISTPAAAVHKIMMRSTPQGQLILQCHVEYDEPLDDNNIDNSSRMDTSKKNDTVLDDNDMFSHLLKHVIAPNMVNKYNFHESPSLIATTNNTRQATALHNGTYVPSIYPIKPFLDCDQIDIVLRHNKQQQQPRREQHDSQRQPKSQDDTSTSITVNQTNWKGSSSTPCSIPSSSSPCIIACTEIRGDWSRSITMEWIEYHHRLGVDHFYIYINEPWNYTRLLPPASSFRSSSTSLLSSSRDYVTYIPYNYHLFDFAGSVILGSDNKPPNKNFMWHHFFQQSQMNDCLYMAKQRMDIVDWVLMTDVDEYIYFDKSFIVPSSSSPTRKTYATDKKYNTDDRDELYITNLKELVKYFPTKYHGDGAQAISSFQWASFNFGGPTKQSAKNGSVNNNNNDTTVDVTHGHTTTTTATTTEMSLTDSSALSTSQRTETDDGDEREKYPLVMDYVYRKNYPNLERVKRSRVKHLVNPKLVDYINVHYTHTKPTAAVRLSSPTSVSDTSSVSSNETKSTTTNTPRSIGATKTTTKVPTMMIQLNATQTRIQHYKLPWKGPHRSGKATGWIEDTDLRDEYRPWLWQRIRSQYSLLSGRRK